MERRARVRVASLIALLAVIVSLFSFRVYKLQSTQTEETIQEALHRLFV